MDKLSWHFCKLATCFSNVSSSHIDLQDDGNESRASDLETQHVCDVDVSMHKQHDKNNGMQGADDIYLHHVAMSSSSQSMLQYTEKRAYTLK